MCAETIVTDHRVDGVPTLVLANKQDCEGAMAVEDIKQMFNQHIVGKLDVSEGAVLPISALRGCDPLLSLPPYTCSLSLGAALHACRDGIREAVDWLFLRVHQCVVVGASPRSAAAADNCRSARCPQLSTSLAFLRRRLSLCCTAHSSSSCCKQRV